MISQEQAISITIILLVIVLALLLINIVKAKKISKRIKIKDEFESLLAFLPILVIGPLVLILKEDDNLVKMDVQTLNNAFAIFPIFATTLPRTVPALAPALLLARRQGHHERWWCGGVRASASATSALFGPPPRRFVHNS